MSRLSEHRFWLDVRDFAEEHADILSAIALIGILAAEPHIVNGLEKHIATRTYAERYLSAACLQGSVYDLADGAELSVHDPSNTEQHTVTVNPERSMSTDPSSLTFVWQEGQVIYPANQKTAFVLQQYSGCNAGAGS